MKYLDNSFRKFVFLSGVLLLLFLSVLILFGFFYYYSTINTYNFVLLILILLTIIITLFYLTSALAIFYVYKAKGANRTVLSIARIGLRALLPLIIFLSDVFKGSKDTIRKFYIEFNNLLVNARYKKYLPQDVLILLPHCLQYSECGYKITNDIDNCRRCRKCTIGDIAEVARQKGVRVYVVTGGTAARNIVLRNRPRLILSVACERDLTSGIIDVGKIPVIGLINDRPNGPCYNTFVDVNALKYRLDSIVEGQE